MQNIGAVIAKHRKRCGLSQAELADKLKEYGIKVKNAAVSSWEKSTNTPTATQLLSLCEILKIQDIYTEFIGPSQMDVLAGLNDVGKERAIEYIGLLRKTADFSIPSIEKVMRFRRVMPIAMLPVSAGSGEMADDEIFEKVEIDGDVPEEAEFGVRLSGNSMEPLFFDGDIVWIKSMKTLDPGDIGIFFLNGNTFCKRLERTEDAIELISENIFYKPIRIEENDDFRVFGKVLNK